MARFETFAPSYRSNAAEAPIIRRWIFRALVLSLIIHAGLVIWFRSTKLERFAPAGERLVPRMFTIPKVAVDPKLLNGDDEPPKAEAQKTPDVKQIELPKEMPSDEKAAGETRVTPVAPSEIATPIAIANEKPRVEPNTVQSLANIKNNAANILEENLASFKDQLLKDKVPKTNSQAMLRISEDATRNGSSAGGNADAAGMAAASGRLDAMLQGSGLHEGAAPLSLPGGALFEFNSVELKQSAIENLRKLGLLIKKHPNVTFVIEGHSDSFGDEESNFRLSVARAESVRTWLVQNMDVNPANIQTKGFGKSKLIVQPKPYDEHSQAAIDAEKARQQPNRRVEVVFRFPKGQ